MAFLGALGTALTAGGATGGAATAIGATAALTAGLGIASSVKSLLSSGDSKQGQPPVALPPKPKVEDAAAKAKEEVAKKRRISLLTGGKTQVTSGQAKVPEAQIGRKSLIGE